MNFKDYMTIAEMAELFGIHKNTVRNWERRGLVKAIRHPTKRERLFKRSDMELLAKNFFLQ
ncbi:MAG TPA: helix-turn-helix domain-containing protein [Candidatus Babeliaceae bacterium]|nr:helix-turn-helix domain-containing protein [Candidatus Babeliaceae bacterium]